MYIVLMAGGVGSRFWPRSRKSTPKQLLNIVSHKSMLQLTYDRVKSLTTADKIYIITNIEQKSQIEQQLPEVNPEHIIAEPMGRNTAPCIGLAASIINARTRGERAVMVVLPADHLISDLQDFQSNIQTGADYAYENDVLITLGIKPGYPETGYGYIQHGKTVFKNENHEIYEVKTFAEKPNLETAKRFLKSGDFFWNSGMFIWSVERILAELDDSLPELREDLRKIEKAVDTEHFYSMVEDVYSRTKSISIDYAVMETAKNVCVIKSEFNWNDLGSWEAVYNISAKDKAGNVIQGKKQVLINSSNNFMYSKNKLIAAVDVDDLVVVEMDDAILICRRDKSQNVKSVVEYLERKDMDEYL